MKTLSVKSIPKTFRFFNNSMFFALVALCLNADTSAMQVKTKHNFDLVRFEQQLKKLPQELQHCLNPLFYTTNSHTYNLQNTQVMFVDYHLVPALFPALSLWGRFRTVNSLRRMQYFIPSSKIVMNKVIFPDHTADLASDRRTIDLLAETQFIRDNHNNFLILSYKDKVETYIHVSHLKTLLKLTPEQVNLIFDLFKAQVPLNKDSHYELPRLWQRTKIVLNESQARIFYSLPAEIQKNLKINYRLTAPISVQLKVKRPRLAARLSQLSRLYTKYDHQPLMRLAKIAIKTGLIYYALHRISCWQRIHHRDLALFIANLLEQHKKKFIIGTAAAIGIIPPATKYVLKKSQRLARWKRKMDAKFTMPLI